MLQGSLDNFALDEVLGLLSSTGKTGRLDLDGDRGTGSLTIRDGALVEALAAGADSGDGPEEVVFELLRYSTGSFRFVAADVPDDAPSRNVAEVLGAAETKLADWRTIEAVVPSLAHRLTPVETLPADEITIGRQEWSALRAIGAAASVAVVCDGLELSEVEGSRQVKGLVERGLLEITEPADADEIGSFHDAPVAQPDFLPVDEASFDEAADDDYDSMHVPVNGDDGYDDGYGGYGDDHGSEDEQASVVTGLFGASAGGHPTPVGMLPAADHDDRPPMPAIPTPEELVAGDVDSGAGFDRRSEDEHGPDGDGNDAQPGGLLMRYLKSDG